MNTKQIALQLLRSLRGSGRTLASFALVLGAIGALVVGTLPNLSMASSHREAPFISTDPQADNTDVYAFVSPDMTNTVTIVANYIPLQQPAAGPNFYEFGNGVHYDINIDNTGNGQADITYRFVFTTEVQNPGTFLYATGPITNINDTDYNFRQYYSVSRIENGTATAQATNRLVPPVNIGPRSTPNYEATAMQGVYNMVNGGKVFVGQRDDPFFVDLGSVFDLAGLRPLNTLHLLPLATEAGVDGVAGYNVHSIAIQVPKSDLTFDHAGVSGPTAANAVVGIWATAARPTTRVIRADGTHSQSGEYVQISRLGNPLINEVLIGRGQKDMWNASYPADDKYYLANYTAPGIVAAANGIYAALDNANETGRADLVAVLLTGLPGLNFTGNTKADMLRLNMGVPVSSNPSRLGPLDPSRTAQTADLQGFPNGRRLADDVTDIELRALLEGYGPVVASLYGVPNRSPNNTVGDGVDANDKTFKTTFPYVAEPWQGYEAEPPLP